MHYFLIFRCFTVRNHLTFSRNENRLMRNLIVTLLIGWAPLLWAQDDDHALPEFQIDRATVEAQLRFLSSDELRGRRAGSPGNDIAARYIAEQLQALGWQTPEGQEDFYQEIPFQQTKPPESAALMVGEKSFTYREDFILLSGEAAELHTEAVFAGHGWVDEDAGRDDYEGLDVDGKVVVVLPGTPEDNSRTAVFQAIGRKRRLAHERGAKGLIEVYQLSFPWRFVRRYFGRETLQMPQEDETDAAAFDELLYGWVNIDPFADQLKAVRNGKKPEVKLSSSGFVRNPLPSQNVVGILPGSDPAVSDEYLLLSAHFDHVGVGKQGGGPFTESDSIFNGARDNAMGVVALLSAARALAEQPARRSVIFLACTAEELGLLGSRYYAEHPLAPLEKTIFNLNTDGAGYSDTSIVSVIGWGRTGSNDLLQEGVNAAGLEIFPNPAPEQGLFDRSDNVSFASKGVPALTFSPGFKTFGPEISKYYHQVADEADSVNFNYLLKFCRAYAHTARLIANSRELPQWKEGDKYEAAGKELYGSGK